MTVVRKRRFVAGSGRRYTDTFCASAQPYGFTTLASANSAFAGTGSSTRTQPVRRSGLEATRRAATLETSASGQLAPSFGRKIGSMPRDWSKRSRRLRGVTLQLSEGWWQETQLRPFVPNDSKNGFVVSSGPV